MKRMTVILFSLIAVLLLAGFVSCKQEVAPEKPVSNEKNLDSALIEAETISNGEESPTIYAGVSGVKIPAWDISKEGYHNINAGVSKALKAGIKNPPELKGAKNLIVIVCEGLTSDLIESSTTKYGELILNSFPVKGETTSKFTSSSGKLLVDYIRNDQFKTITGIMVHGDTACNSMRRITTTKDNLATAASVYRDQFMLNPPLVYVMGEGDFDDIFSPASAEYLNEVYKSSGKKVDTLGEAIPLYKNNNVHFEADEAHQHDGAVRKLYTIFKSEETLPSFRQEMEFSLAWMQSKKDDDGFCLFSSYSVDSIDANGVQNFDEGVAVAVRYALENPDTAILVCGCPSDGSEADVCFYGFGKDVSVKGTLYDCVTSLY